MIVEKKKINSKKKGNSFESTISKLLTEKLNPLKFRRSQSSGAILGGQNSKLIEHFSDDAKALFVGDVVPTNESDVFRDFNWKFKFTLECKFYKDCDNLEHLFNKTKIKDWIGQSLIDANKINKQPLLIFKFNRTDTYGATIREKDKNLNEILPKTLTKQVIIIDDSIDYEIIIFKLSEALLDLEWWKQF